MMAKLTVPLSSENVEMPPSRDQPSHELMASLLAVRTSNLIKAELDFPIDRVVFWTDSLMVLQYKNET